MPDNQNSTPDIERLTYVSKEEPTIKAPPALETGVLRWMRSNLFSSVVNTLLTIFGFVLVVFSVIGLVTWVVQDANWFAISFNFRQLMLGRYEAAYEWRTTVTALFVIFVLGAAMAVWVKQIVRVMTITMIVILLMVFLMPVAINSIYTLPSYIVAAGSGSVTLGGVSSFTDPSLAFVAQAGEKVEIRIASSAAGSDESLIALNGFVDTTANTLRNAAQNRLDAMAQQAELQRVLEEDAASEIPLLTAGQRDRLASQLEALVIPEEVITTYAINQTAIEVIILNAQTLEPVGDAVVLGTAEDIANFTLPETGWYILQSAPVQAVAEGVNALTLLDIHGIYPLLLSANFDPDAGRFVDTFIRMTDNYRMVQPVPQIDGADVPFVVVTRNQYRGERPVADWLRAYVSPFLQRISVHVAILIAFGAAGYVAVSYLESTRRKATARRFATMLLLSVPIVVWIFINGMSELTALLWMAVVGLIVYSILLYRLAKAKGKAGWWQSGSLPIVSLLIVVGYAACIVLFNSTPDGGLPRTLLILGFIPLLASAIYGTSAHIPGDDVKVTLPLLLGLSAALYLIPLVLVLTGIVKADSLWLFSESDPRNWGGLLLTMMLTLYGIIAAFPIGVGLALGRRSDMPAIRYICTGYIELVRGSPFVTVLFFMQLLIPLINQSFAEVPNSYRALIATIAFSAAYLAENVRGGLQSLPNGQTEAAKALGLNAWQMTILITLPQALRAVIPVLVGQFIGLFKDTSLVAIVGLIDLTGFVNTMVVQAEFVGTRLEGLLFISLLYFVFSYVMSYVSRLLEASGSGSTRRM